MKNIFIGGVAKSGKSRLATELCKKHGMNHIPLDYFASSFKHNFPECGITSNVVIEDDSSEQLAKFISRFIEIAESNDEERFIIDSAHILPRDIIKYINFDKWDVYYLGYPNVNVEDKISEIKKYFSDGWFYKRSERELVKIFEELVSLSKKIEKECKQYDITFIDTSEDDILNLFE